MHELALADLVPQRNQLKNGITTQVLAVPGRKRVYVLFYLRTGSRYESAAENGLSHFVEHMLFRGTEDHPTAHLLAQAFEDLGGTLDASTAADHGTLGIAVPAENLAAVLPLMAEVYQRPLFSDLELERGIIREEVHEELNEAGQWIDPQTLARASAFSSSGLGQPILGPLANVESFTLAQLRAHHQKTYVGNQLVVTVAGPVDVAATQRALEQQLSGIPLGSPLSYATPPIQNGPRFIHVEHPGTSQTSLSLSYRALGNADPREPALDMLLRIIDDGMATRLYHQLCDQGGLCYSVSGSYEAYEDAGLIEFEADTAHSSATQVVQRLYALTDELSSHLVSDREFERARNRARWQFDALADETGDTADFLAMASLSGSDASPAQRLQKILSVTKEDLRDLAASLFVPAGRNLVAVGSAKPSLVTRLEKLAL